MANPISTAVQNQWKFGFSEQRIGENGAVRQATEEEILAETKSSPGAMVKLLGAGADLLRFDANGQYSEHIHKIAEIQAQEGKTPELIAAEVDKAVEELRNAMRADIKAGVFKVEDSGQVLHNGQPISPESVGFELNALLIESLSDTVSELNALKSQIASLNQFVSEQFASNDAANESRELPLVYEQSSFYYFQSRTEKDGKKKPPDPDWQVEAIPTDSAVKDLRTIKQEQTPLDEFVSKNKDTFSGILDEGLSEFELGKELLSYMEGNYKRLLSGVSGVATNWLDSSNNRQTPSQTPPSDEEEDNVDFYRRGEGPLNTPELYKALKPKDLSQFTNVNRVYRAHQVTYQENVQVIGKTTLVDAGDALTARIGTVSSLTEQLGTNFKVDNSRYNSLIEAMNNYNKSVLDSLRRFSII